MNSTCGNYRLHINQLDNGYTVKTDNDNAPSIVFEELEDLLEYVKTFFEVGEETRKNI